MKKYRVVTESCEAMIALVSDLVKMKVKFKVECPFYWVVEFGSLLDETGVKLCLDMEAGGRFAGKYAVEKI